MLYCSTDSRPNCIWKFTGKKDWWWNLVSILSSCHRISYMRRSFTETEHFARRCDEKRFRTRRLLKLNWSWFLLSFAHGWMLTDIFSVCMCVLVCVHGSALCWCSWKSMRAQGVTWTIFHLCCTVVIHILHECFACIALIPHTMWLMRLCVCFCVWKAKS